MKNLEEIKEEVRDSLIRMMDLRDEEDYVKEISVEDLSKNGSIYEFFFTLYKGIAETLVYRCLYFTDLDETYMYEYDKTGVEASIT